MKKLRIVAFGGFRSIPPKAGGAGSDKFAYELYPRFVEKGHSVVAYTRKYKGDAEIDKSEYEGIKLIPFKTVSKAGFDSLLHSFKAAMHIIFKNTGDFVHVHSGANSVWVILLRAAGKKVFVSQFAMDWKRDKWPWYGKLYYLVSIYLTAFLPNRVIFDNIYTRDYFEERFKKKFDFIPYGSEVPETDGSSDILEKLGLQEKEYFLFVGRFIPDKGLHLLVNAFEKIKTNKKLVLIGGSPNPDKYENDIKNTDDSRIIFPGYIYGDDTNTLIKNAYAYIQPSLIEGLSPVILTVMGLGTPLICSDIKENLYITKENAVHFVSGDSQSLMNKIEYALDNEQSLKNNALSGRIDISDRFNWDKITDSFIEIFKQC